MNEPFPVLGTPRLLLIEMNETHIDELYRLFRDEEITRYTRMVPFTAESSAKNYVEWMRKRFQDGMGIYWGITLKETGELIGTVGFNFYTSRERGNLGYDLQKAYWRQGYMTEALFAVLCYGFVKLEINRMEAEVMQGNRASERLLEKIGFRKEGLLRNWMCKEKCHYNVSMYSLLLTDVMSGPAQGPN